MDNQKRKLGRGLSALIGESKSSHSILDQEGSPVDNIRLVKITKIQAGKYQPREEFNEDKINELADSIKENGILQPIILRKVGAEGGFEIIAGERRFRASKKAGLKEIPAIIKKLNNHQALELAIVENVQRSDLTVVEEAKSYKKLMKEFSYSQEEVAKKVGKSRSHVANNLRLLTLPQNIQDLLNNDQLTMGHARAIIKADNKEQLVKDIIANKLSVRKVEEILRLEKFETNAAGNLPMMITANSKTKYLNNDYITSFEEVISRNSGLKAQIKYNSLLNKGKVTLKFYDINKLQQFIAKIEVK